MRKSLLLAATTPIFLAAMPASAATVVFENRDDFEAASGSLAVFDFNGFTADTSFRTAPLDVGPFTLQTTGAISPFLTGRNLIDVPPLVFTTFNVDGTAILNGFVTRNLFSSSVFDIIFDTPIFSFGADFADLQTDTGTTRLIVNGEALAPSVAAPNAVRFFGFTSTEAFTTVRFDTVGFGSDGFGADNITFGGAAVVAAVPEPATWLTLILGFAFVGGSMRSRRTGGRAVTAT